MTDMTRAIEGAKDGSVLVRGAGPNYALAIEPEFDFPIDGQMACDAVEYRVRAHELAALRAAYPKKFKEM